MARTFLSKCVSEAERAWFPVERGERGREPSSDFLAGEIDCVNFERNVRATIDLLIFVYASEKLDFFLY